MKKYIYLIIAFVWTLVIFSFSIQSGEASSGLSSGFTVWVHRIIVKIIPNLSIDTFHAIVRKTAHVFEYMVLGILYAQVGFVLKLKKWMFLLCGIVIALIDEGIQIMAIERGPSVIDALLFDFPGYIMGGLMIAYLINFNETKKLTSH